MQSPGIPDASLSRDLQSERPPRLVHTLHKKNNSVLSLAASDRYIFSGNENHEILVWDKKTYTLKETLSGHTGSILGLVYAKEKDWLISSSGDSTIRVWSTTFLNPIYTLDPYEETGSGDLFALSWSASLQTLYIGCQNTSLQWFDFKTLEGTSSTNPGEAQPRPSTPGSGTATPSSSYQRKAHKFFDSYPLFERRPADIYANNTSASQNPAAETLPVPHLKIAAEQVSDWAHHGYIYCMALLEESEGNEVHLVTGSGDETVKLWNCSSVLPRLVHTFEANSGAVYAVVAKYETIFAGCQDGHVKVFDLETKTLVRTLIVQEGIDILSLTMIGRDLYTCSANGQIQRYAPSFDSTASWRGHQGIVLSSIASHSRDGGQNQIHFITGGNDDTIKVWNLHQSAIPTDTSYFADESYLFSDPQSSAGVTLEYALSKFIAIPSVSNNTSNREDCRQAAIWLKKCLNQLGAQSSLLATEGQSPLVLATFSGATRNEQKKPRVLFYGHYDVMPAPRHGWNSEPFTMTGKNGYLYGRGVTDNKGPVLAVACAASVLLHQRALAVDLVLLIEGEEECGSYGFEAAVQKYKEQIGPIDAILVSNSTWIGEDTPCITYGLRGVVHCSLDISSGNPDLHSGVDGGGVAEPMLDMIKLLATLTEDKKVLIPGFYDSVVPQTKREVELYQHLANVTNRPASTLSSRWREPSLTVHSIEISGPKNATVIPGTVRAQLSIRIVPNQDLNVISSSLCNHLQTAFEGFNSPNNLKTTVQHTADWWLGDLDDHWFQALESAVREEWGVDPLRIREGGSIPSVPYLEKEFGCRALHLPIGQRSDSAHLPNERISLMNLHRGKQVVERFLRKIGETGSSA